MPQTTPQETDLVVQPQYIQPEIVEVLRETSLGIVSECSADPIQTADQYAVYVEYVRRGKESVRSLEDRLREPIKKAFEAHRSLTALLRELTEPAKQRIDAADREATRWWNEQERLRLQREADEREAQAKERRRLEEERQQKIKEQQQADLKLAKTEQKLTAKRAEAMGMPDVAEEIMSQPVMIEQSQIAPLPAAAPVVVEKTAPVMKGRSYRKGKWVFEIVDPALVPDEYWFRSINEKKIQADVEALQAACKIPGVRVYQEEAKGITRIK